MKGNWEIIETQIYEIIENVIRKKTDHKNCKNGINKKITCSFNLFI